MRFAKCFGSLVMTSYVTTGMLDWFALCGAPSRKFLADVAEPSRFPSIAAPNVSLQVPNVKKRSSPTIRFFFRARMRAHKHRARMYRYTDTLNTLSHDTRTGPRTHKSVLT
jgi:hypothetical protein